jgi:hypothetical protein
MCCYKSAIATALSFYFMQAALPLAAERKGETLKQ